MRIKSKTGYKIVFYGTALYIGISCIYTAANLIKWLIEKLF